MNDTLIDRLCREHLGTGPQSVERCTVGHGNYVCIVNCSGDRYVLRCTDKPGAYDDTAHWLERLAEVNVPVPKVIAKGRLGGWEYLILTYIDGRDIGVVYRELTRDDKRAIARHVTEIQARAALLEPENIRANWTWLSFVDEMLDRSEQRIIANGYFDAERVCRLREASHRLNDYFAAVSPIVYLDDISTKNLLISNGRLSGVIDVDWIGVGDRLTFAALTYIALLNMDCDTDYVSFLLEEMNVTGREKEAFLFYSLMYCVDFMGERGMNFLDRRVEVNDRIIERLNGIYDMLWEQWIDHN